MIKENIKIVEEGLIGENSIPSKLRNENFFDLEAFNKVVDAIMQLIEAFENQELVPKSLCLCFVDISNHFFVNENDFEEDQVEQIEDAGMKLSELANKLFSS